MQHIWTPEEESLLAKLWDEGYSASAIAAHFPYATRNSIIGKKARLGLPLRKVPGKRLPLRKVPGKRLPKLAATSVQPIIPAEIIAPVKPLDSRPTLESMRHFDCHWPMWGDHEHPQGDDIRFCGEPIVRGSYCFAHAERAYVVPKARTGR